MLALVGPRREWYTSISLEMTNISELYVWGNYVFLLGGIALELFVWWWGVYLYKLYTGRSMPFGVFFIPLWFRTQYSREIDVFLIVSFSTTTIPSNQFYSPDPLPSPHSAYWGSCILGGKLWGCQLDGMYSSYKFKKSNRHPLNNPPCMCALCLATRRTWIPVLISSSGSLCPLSLIMDHILLRLG